MNFKNRIEELNTNLVLQETKMLLVIDNLKSLILKTDSNSKKSFVIAINELQHFKDEYNSITIQLNTLLAYQARK